MGCWVEMPLGAANVFGSLRKFNIQVLKQRAYLL